MSGFFAPQHSFGDVCVVLAHHMWSIRSALTRPPAVVSQLEAMGWGEGVQGAQNFYAYLSSHAYDADMLSRAREAIITCKAGWLLSTSPSSAYVAPPPAQPAAVAQVPLGFGRGMRRVVDPAAKFKAGLCLIARVPHGADLSDGVPLQFDTMLVEGGLKAAEEQADLMLDQDIADAGDDENAVKHSYAVWEFKTYHAPAKRTAKKRGVAVGAK